ncbi:helix-turn-helix domain-containing protein [Phytohabitans kaempferiae]|uniref:Helix-turn-helix domain-containing protein n=1 Tax=Phytohabitans kaempferiae TaxID=1620943 RepID=A0ABV6LX99_9ACTN
MAGTLATDAAPGEIAWRGSQEALARILGLSRVTVNRTLRRLTDSSAIAITRSGVAIRDPRALHEIAARGATAHDA